VTSILIRVKILEGKERDFEEHIAKLVRDVHANEPDPKIYEFRRVQGEPRTYILFQAFKDEAAYDRYANSAYHLEASPKGQAMLDGEPVVEYLEIPD